MKGGVGKTTVAALLGLVLAENRGDRVIALDANPDAGTLADRLTGGSAVTVREFLRDLDQMDSWAAVARSTSLVGRLQVLGSEPDPGAAGGLDRVEYERVCDLLERYFNIVITDSGTGFVHPAMAGTLARADSLVIVGAPTVDGAGRASKTLDWLWSNGYGSLAARGGGRAERLAVQRRGEPRPHPPAFRGALPGRRGHPARSAPGHRWPSRARPPACRPPGPRPSSSPPCWPTLHGLSPPRLVLPTLFAADGKAGTRCARMCRSCGRAISTIESDSC